MNKQQHIIVKAFYEKPWVEEIECHVSQSILVESYGEEGSAGRNGGWIEDGEAY